MIDEVELRDGSRILIRAIVPDDREALADGHSRLSRESQYRRFFGAKPHLTERDLDYLTRVDHHDHEALAAIDAETGDFVGVARYVRTAEDTAEPAVAVTDDWQRRGVATELLERLVARAREEGIRRLDAPVLATNAEAIRLVERLGPTTIRQAGREAVLHVELPERGAPQPVLEMLRRVAAGTLPPGRTLLALVVPERRGALGDPRLNRIVVGCDGSEHARLAEEVAAQLAVVSGAAVHVVGAHGLSPVGHHDVDVAVQAGAERMRRLGLEVQEHLRRGEAGPVLADVAHEEHARLIVVGAGEHTVARRRLLGSAADAVARRAPCDVLIVRPPRS